jgi:hypothetical protein
MTASPGRFSSLSALSVGFLLTIAVAAPLFAADRSVLATQVAQSAGGKSGIESEDLPLPSGSAIPNPISPAPISPTPVSPVPVSPAPNSPSSSAPPPAPIIPAERTQQPVPPLLATPRTRSSLETAPPGTASALPVMQDNLDRTKVDLSHPKGLALDASAWQGVAPEVALTEIEMLPANPQSATLRDLARQLLMADPTALAPTQKVQLLAARVKRLRSLGFADDARSLLDGAADVKADPIIRGIRFDVELLAKGSKIACADLEAHPTAKGSATPAGPADLRRDEVFCLALAKKTDEATLAADLLRERNEADPAFLALIDMMLGGDDIVLENQAQPTVLQFAAFQSLNKRLPPEILRSSDAGLLAALLAQPSVPMVARIDAAERTLSVGAIGDTVLAGLYGSDDNVMEPSGPRGRAMLYRQARDQSQPQLRAEALAALWSQAKTENRLVPVMLVASSLIGDLSPSPETLWFAPAATRALYLAGRMEAARTWYAQTRDAAERFGDVWREALIELWPVAYMADGDGSIAFDQVLLDAWTERQRRGAANARIERITALVQALNTVSSPIAGAPSRAPLSLTANAVLSATDAATPPIARLEQAAAAGHKAETISLSLALIGDRDLSWVTPAELSSVVRALIKVGLPYEARRFAIDAALAAGA